MTTNRFDFIVIGAGHHGLSMAGYLANGGFRTLLLERRHEMGGGLSTEEVTLPGFYHNLHSNFHGLIPFMPCYTDFELEKAGVHYYHPEANLGMPLKDGRALVLYSDEIKSYESLLKFSKKDADAYASFKSSISDHMDELLTYVYSPPTKANEEGSHRLLTNLYGAEILQQSPYDWVKSYFENPHVQALCLFHMAIAGFDVTQKGMAKAGIGYLGFATNWQLCRGGSHFLAHALGGYFLRQNGFLEENAPVKRILLEGNRAVGVETTDGEKFYADKAVISAIDAQQTLIDFLPADALKTELREKVSKLDYGTGDSLFAVHLALKEVPRYSSGAYNPDINRTFNLNIGYETPEDVAEHFVETRSGEVPKVPRLNCSVNTLFDQTQAPEGFHTGLIWQFAPYSIEGKGPEHWNDIKTDFAKECIRVWSEYAPNLADSVIDFFPYTPLDIGEKMVNMRNGGFHCASVMPSQLQSLRPTAELSGYRTPIDGLYMCGSCMHAHGGITGSPSYAALQVIADDFQIRDKLKIGNKFWEKSGAAK